jgi:hypothetical protein
VALRDGVLASQNRESVLASKLRDAESALWHMKFKNHKFNPEACSVCELVDIVLTERSKS